MLIGLNPTREDAKKKKRKEAQAQLLEAWYEKFKNKWAGSGLP